MASTLKARAGSSLKFHIDAWADGEQTERLDTSNYTAKFQLRATQPRTRVLLDETEVVAPNPETIPEDAVFVLIEMSHWRVFLGKTQTSKLPPTTRFEVELTSKTNPEDVFTLCTGSIQTEPQVVTSVE